MESELAARGIFRSWKSSGHRCRLCASNADFFDPIRHSRDSRHSAIKERFALIFEGRCDTVRCTVCAIDFAWEDLSEHARLHRLTPWYAPSDRYRIFFENHIVERATQFYCCLCNKMFAEWSSALAHTEDEGHAALVQIPPGSAGSARSSTDVPYELLVKEDIVAGSDKTFACTLCRRDGIALPDLAQHCRDAQHTKLKMHFSVEMQERRRKFVDSTAREDTKNGFEDVSSKYFFSASHPTGKNGSEDFFPASLLTEKKGSEASEDFFPASHLKENKGPKASNDYLPALNPIEKKGPEAFTDPFQKSLVKKGLEAISSENSFTGLDSNAYIYIVEYEDTYNCKLCSCTLADSESVERHLRGITHSTSLKTRGCDSIVFDEACRENYCKACECRVLGASNVVQHVLGARHTASLSQHRSIEPEEIDVFPEQDEPPEVPFEPARLPENHISKTGGYIFCHICNWNVVPNATDDHVTGVRHQKSIERFYEQISVRGEHYRCACCDCVVQGLDGLYFHLKSYQHRTTSEKIDSVKVASPEKAPVEKSRDQHIAQSQADDFRCKICDCDVHKDRVDAHVAGVEHARAVREFEAFVTRLKGDKYRCEACRCTIRGFDNVYIHLHGSRHRSPAIAESRQTGDDTSGVKKLMNNLNLEDVSQTQQKL